MWILRKDFRYMIPSTSAFGSLPYNKQTTTENRDFRRVFGRSQNGYQPTDEMTTRTYTERESVVYNNYYQAEYNEKSSSQQNLLKSRHPNDQTQNNVRNVTTHYYTKTCNYQATVLWQDQEPITTVVRPPSILSIRKPWPP